MGNFTPFALLILPISAVQIPALFSAAFTSPLSEKDAPLLSANETLTDTELLKRQLGSGGCPANFNPCRQNGYGGACCTAGSFCTTDVARNIACCPSGATCTGTLGGAFAPNTGTVTTTTTNGFGTPTTAAAVSFITNPYYPFPIIALSYPQGSTACETALSACQTNYAACTQNLQGGGFGVTVVAPNGGGVTVAPTAQNLGVAQATSICQSLSAQACHGLTDNSQCVQFGVGNGNGGTFVVSATGNAGARATAAVGCIAGVVAGVGLGIAGQMV